MSILKYKDPKTGEFKRINPYKADLSFVGKDGVVVNKAANSEMVEISGSGCVQNSNKTGYVVYTRENNVNNARIFAVQPNPNSFPVWNSNNELEGAVTSSASDNVLTNKKYVDSNYVKKVKFTNLEQALNGYILDTTKEAYADLDSAVLKDSVAVGDNVYPIADKTRALVTRIEGKTTKMVQLLDKSTFPATSTPTAGVTVTKTDDGGLHVLGTSASSGGRNSWGITVKIKKGHKYLSLLKGNNKITIPFVTLKSDTPQYVGFVADIVTSTIEGECYYGFNLAAEDYDETIYPQLFDLTAMNRENITTVEQFKAEFPDIYPYENGNIYPAKISGVKFTGKNLLKLELSSTNKCNTNIEDDVLKITPTTQNAEDIVFAEVKTHLKAGEYVLSSISENQNTTPTQFIVSKGQYGENNITTISSKGTKFTLDSESDIYILIYPCLHAELPFKAMSVQIQIQAGSQATAYEPYIDPASVTLPETYDLHGIGDYKDYLEITKNEDNELYTLKKVQVIDKHVFDGTETWGVYNRVNFENVAFRTTLLADKYTGWYSRGNLMNLLVNIKTIRADKKGYTHGDTSSNIYISLPNIATPAEMKAHVLAMYEAGTPYVFYGAIQTPVETVIATNLTYEQVTAIRHNGGLIEVVGNTNKAYAKPTIKNTVVYRLTATNTAEG